MRTIFSKRNLKAGDEIVIHAPTANIGDEVKIVNPLSLDPYKTALCVGEIPPLFTPSRHGRKGNAYRDYRKFVVKPLTE